MKKNFTYQIVALAIIALLPPPSQTWAAVLEEIIVSARKKDETLKEVPISISVTSGDTIQEQGLRDIQAVVATLPAVNLSKAGAGAFINIRGVGSGENSGFEQSVGYVVDGISLGRSRATRAGVVDLARVEVLKGPQTTYFGANTIAGVINVTTRGASLEDGLEGYVSSSYEFETEEKVLEAAVNLPVTDSFALRLAGKYSDSDGYITNHGLGNKEPAIEDELFRVSALWAPVDNFEAELKYTSVDTEANSALDIEIVNCVPGGPAQLNCIQADGSPVEDGLDYNKNTDLPGQFRRLDLEVGTLNLNYHLGEYKLTSVTGYYEFENEFLLDLDITSVPSLFAPSRFAISQFDGARNFSQELRLTAPTVGKYSWDVGVYYQDESATFSNVVVAAFSPPAPVPPAAMVGARSSQDSKTSSVFGTLSYDIFDRLIATLGLRYIEVEKTITQPPQQPAPIPANNIPNARAFMPFGGFAFDTASRTDHELMSSIDLQYLWTDNTNIYGSFRQGFKAGGFSLANPPQGVVVDFIQGFEPETVDAFEIGAKGTYLDGRLDANVAIFHAEYKDRQVSSLADDGASLTQAVANAATSTSQGVELDFTALVGERWTIKGAFTLLDSSFDKFTNSPCYTGQTAALGCVGGVQNLSGATTTYAPDYAGSLIVKYEQPLGGYTLSVEPNVLFSDGYALISDLNPLNFQDSFIKANLRIALAPDSDRWELAFVGRNLNDEITSHFCQEAVAAPGGSVACSPDLPATYAIQGRLSF